MEYIKIIGVAGAQGTGKTTLCDHVAKATDGAMFVKTNLGAVLEKRKSTTDQIIKNPALMVMIQAEMVTYLHYVIETAVRFNADKKALIFDRTFVDIAAYTQSVIPYDLADDSFELADALRIVDQCINLQRDVFDFTFVVQPGVELTAEDFSRENRGRLNWLTQHRVNGQTLDVAQAIRPSHICPNDVTDLDERIALLKKVAHLG